MDGIGHQLLAGAGLAEQEHGVGQRRHLADQGEHVGQAAVAADDLRLGQAGRAIGAEMAVLEQQLAVALHPFAGQGPGQCQ